LQRRWNLEYRAARIKTRMKRTVAATWLATLVAANITASAQEDVLKPFRPNAPEPAGEIPKGKPTKPIGNAAEEVIPRGVLIKRPTPAPGTPGEAPAAAPTPRATPRPPTAQPARPAAIPEPDGDIVIKPGGTPTSPDQVQLQYADGFFSRKMFRDAAPEYERYLDQFPRTAAADRQAAYYRLAECYRNTDALNNAKANYETLLGAYPDGEFVGYAAYRLGTILYEEKDYRAALPVYRRASVRLRQPTLVVASKFFVGRCLEATGQKSEARATYEDVAGIVAGNPYQDASRLSVGRLLTEGNRKDDALKWLLPLAAETPNPQIKAEATARAGLLQLDIGKVDEAEKTIATALAMPENGAWKDDLNVALYQLLYEKKDFKGLIAKFEGDGNGKSLKLENRLRILVIVGRAHSELGNKAEAMKIYEQIMTDFPATTQSRDAAYARLIMLYDSDDQRLLDELNRFLTENPTAPQVENVSLMKAEVLFNKADYTNSAPIYQLLTEKGRKLAPATLGECLFRLGVCRSRLQQYDKADEVFTRFLKEFPGHPKTATALAERGESRKELKQFASALKDFVELTTKHPKAKEREFGLENQALLQSQLGDNAKMAETFEILIRDFPATPAKAKASHWIGWAAMEGKNYKKAIEFFRKAREADEKTWFDRDTLAVIICAYNLDDWTTVETEIALYAKAGGKTEIPTEIVRGLAQNQYKSGGYDKVEQHIPGIILRKEATPDDYLLLARARVKLAKFKDAVDSYDSYLSLVKDPVPRAGGLLEKCDAQIKGDMLDAARKTADEGLSFAPEGKANGEFRLRAGEIEFVRKNYVAAMKVFEGLIATLPDDEDVTPRAIERAIECHKFLSNDSEVKRLENLIRSRFPEYLQKKGKAK
jgi:tetratricopeptide (TPR) repeat protein